MIDAALVNVILDLLPRLLEQPVALEPSDPPFLSRIGRASSVGLPHQDHSLELVDSFGGLC